MSEVSDYPYILCPDLDQHGVRVAPLWFKPKGGGMECPVILLENVPIGYSTSLEAMGFLQRPGGWIIDVTDKGEHFWRSLFGDIAFVQRKPVKVYEPNRIVFAPPPPAIKVVITNYTDEHIKILTEKDQVIGLDARREAQKDAIRGAITCRGAWSVVKGACLDRLSKNPEDVQAFEFAWATANAQGLDATGLPDEIPHDALLKKIVERQRFTAQMEAVIASDFVRTGAVTKVAHVEWAQRRCYTGSEIGGPLDTHDFNEVDSLAQLLLDEGYQPLADKQRIDAFQARVKEVSMAQSPGDWTDDLDIPDLPEQETGVAFESLPAVEEVGPESERSTQQATVSPDQDALIPWAKTYERLSDLAALAERRVPYARVICRYLFDQIIHQQGIALNHPAVLTNLESLLNRFGAVVNRDTLEKLWDREGYQLVELADALGIPGQARMRIKKVLLSPKHTDAFIESKLLESGGELMGWWWNGYSCSRTPSNQQWQLYRIEGERCHPIGTGLYATPRHADQALHEYVRTSRLAVLRQNAHQNAWFHGFKTSSGPILQLSDCFDIQSEAEEALLHRTPTYLTELHPPVLWQSEPCAWEAALLPRLLRELVETLELPEPLADLDGSLRFDDSPEGVRAYWKDVRLPNPGPGSLVFTWAEALYRHYQAHAHSDVFSGLLDGLLGEPAYADLDISLEDDLLDDLDDVADELNAQLGSRGEQVFRKAITAPGEETERECERLILALRDEQRVSRELSRFVRSALLFCAQHRPYSRMTQCHQEALRLKAAPPTLFSYAIARITWLRLAWAGRPMELIVAVGAPGDLVAGELFPQGSILWDTAHRLTRLLEGFGREDRGGEQDHLRWRLGAARG